MVIRDHSWFELGKACLYIINNVRDWTETGNETVQHAQPTTHAPRCPAANHKPDRTYIIYKRIYSICNIIQAYLRLTLYIGHYMLYDNYNIDLDVWRTFLIAHRYIQHRYSMQHSERCQHPKSALIRQKIQSINGWNRHIRGQHDLSRRSKPAELKIPI